MIFVTVLSFSKVHAIRRQKLRLTHFVSTEMLKTVDDEKNTNKLPYLILLKIL